MKPHVFTPLHPARGGIADSAEALPAHWAGRFDPTVFIAGHEPEVITFPVVYVRPLSGVAICARPWNARGPRS